MKSDTSMVGYITGQETIQVVSTGPDGHPLRYPMTHVVKSDSLCSVEIAARAKGPPSVTVKVYTPHEREAGDRALAEWERLTNYFAQRGETA